MEDLTIENRKEKESGMMNGGDYMMWQVVVAFLFGLMLNVSIKIENKSEAYHRGFIKGLEYEEVVKLQRK